MPGEKLGRIAVVTVHGTGDTAPKPDGDKWFQRGAAFTEKLKALLREKGVEADIHPVLWSGANSARAREDGADEVADAIKRLTREYDGQVHLIGHSHGGNVVNEAVDLLRWGRTKGKSKVASVTTVGTPFFKSQLGAFGSFGGIAFTVLTSLLVPILVILAVALAFAEWDETEKALRTGLIVYILGSAAVLAYMMRLAIQWRRRVLRPRTMARSTGEIYAISHPNDEAITFLTNVERFPVEPFTRGALLRNSRAIAISWSVWLTIFGFAALPLLLLAPQVRAIVPASIHVPEIEPVSVFLGITAIPLGWLGAYAFAIVMFGLLPELAFRNWFNRTVGAIMRGMAFGRDGDDRIGNVSAVSHTHPTRSALLEGDLAKRLQDNAGSAADKLIAKYRWALFSTTADSADSIAKLSTDAMTWDSLIHTTYFEQPEIAEMIAAYIAEKAAKPD